MKATLTMRELRALAKRKGGWVDVETYGHGALSFVLRGLRFSSVWINYGGGGLLRSEARQAMFAALSALPDAPKGAKR